ncbi:acyl-CoA/acyl-ACP dehydrogenase [Streptomyces tubbatahanensis]|uniref:Acyl-CoA/acyl-ACP dehydrogenase n=1 Tax=Streptomyces tubbatahanensis TaxID=2923272 RepID=A0ABY3XSV3_9ACTN|nr:acyl-CoA dehydrogenase family protein [Streptomyces tubbatahanensis]UNS97559.1 acyl-CoA/acyl-ACP dehydrogenase [Streptomyces tubbatahanensis]
MDFRLTDDQEALKRGMRQLLDRRFGPTALHQAADPLAHHAPREELARLWGQLGEAGLFSLRADESAGGVGLGLPEAVLVFEEAGRALLPGPLVATHLAGSWGLVPGAGEGRAVVTAMDAGPSSPGRTSPPAGAVPDTMLVEHLEAADAVLLVGGGEVRLLETTGSALNETVKGGEQADNLPAAAPVLSVDPLSPLHRVTGRTSPGSRTAAEGRQGELRNALEGQRKGPEGQRKGPEEGSEGAQKGVEGARKGLGEGVARGMRGGLGERLCAVDADVLRREAGALTAAQQLGSAHRTLELAVGYARAREQFGRPIGTFQAVQHLCAGMLVRAETARSAVYAAAVTREDEETCAAKLLADEAATSNARDCLQVFGGMGFTWEAEVHLHLKRAWLRAEQWVTSVAAEEKLATALL